jgi:MerR family transcriptional regulator, light-induced transcriptional regulator
MQTSNSMLTTDLSMPDLSPALPTGPLVSIAVAERLTGVPKDSLRVWERRYGFPRPGRDGFDERTYTPADIEKLKVIKRLMDIGHRPGKLVLLSLDVLSRMGEPRELRRRTAERHVYSPEKRQDLLAYMQLIDNRDMVGVRARLVRHFESVGMIRFVTEHLYAVSQMVNDAALSGKLPVFSQRLYTEAATRVMQHLMSVAAQTKPPRPVGAPDAEPRVLCASFTGDANGVGLLMIEALLTESLCSCVALGARVGVADIAQAAIAHSSQVVALSFVDRTTPSELLNGLDVLRKTLPASVEIWVCGPCPAFARRPVDGVLAVTALEAFDIELARVRAKPKLV